MVKLKNPSRPPRPGRLSCILKRVSKPRDGGTERRSQHKHDGRSAGAPAGAAERRDPARDPPPRGRFVSFRGEAALGLFTLVRRMQARIAGKVAQQTAAADAQADTEADGGPPARPVDAVRGHWGLTMLPSSVNLWVH